jgi:hypothetical protein
LGQAQKDVLSYSNWESYADEVKQWAHETQLFFLLTNFYTITFAIIWMHGSHQWNFGSELGTPLGTTEVSKLWEGKRVGPNAWKVGQADGKVSKIYDKL